MPTRIALVLRVLPATGIFAAGYRPAYPPALPDPPDPPDPPGTPDPPDPPPPIDPPPVTPGTSELEIQRPDTLEAFPLA